MAGRALRGGCGPKRVKATGGKRGWAEDDASGFTVYADERVFDHRQGMVRKDLADTTPGFGTYHPQDVKSLGNLDDPNPIPNAKPLTEPDFERCYSDAELQRATREGRRPRKGY